jgi:hypothetical protein
MGRDILIWRLYVRCVFTYELEGTFMNWLGMGFTNIARASCAG